MGMLSHIEDEILELETHELVTIKIIVDKELKHRKDKKCPYDTVTYTCPGCGATASQTWTKLMNEQFLKNAEGTFCPDCEKKIVH